MIQSTSLGEAAGAAKAWLFDAAVPLWIEHGVDRERGGVYEALDQQTLENRADFKRLRVATRQTYVFAQGAHRGVSGAREAAEHALAFVLGPMRHPDGGFASRCDLDGRITDPTRDLYDLAFVLFALAHGYRLTGVAALKAEALALLHFLDAEMRHPAGGFVEALPPRSPRRQNPHMHLLEAALATAELMPDPAFDALADELTDLALARFIDPAHGVLPEYYEEDWAVQRDAEGRALTEPGHHFEWAWLLSEVARVRGRTVAGGPALARFALHHGLDPATGLLRGELFDDGAIAAAEVRLWPHGEWLKAALALPGEAGEPLAAWNALKCFLQSPIRGLWHEHWSPSSAFQSPSTPASSLYHIATAIDALVAKAGEAADGGSYVEEATDFVLWTDNKSAATHLRG